MSLPTQSRLTLLLLFVLAAFWGCLLVLQRTQERQVGLLYDERVTETSAIFDRLLLLKGKGFSIHASDYSRSNDFVAFVRKPDPTWARINLQESISEFSVDMAWVLDRQFKTIYVATVDGVPRLAEPPVARDRFAACLAAQPFQHFFARTPAAVIEVWTAPIQPSNDLARRTPAAGYYVIGRYWRGPVLKELSELNNGKVVLLRGAATDPAPEEARSRWFIDVRRTLTDLDHRAIATLVLRVGFPTARQIDQSARQTLWFMAIAALAVLTIAHAFLSGWVARPLGRIRAALLAEDAAPLGATSRRRDEFGRLAALVTEFFAQRGALLLEVRVRREAEQEVVRQKELIRRVIDTDPNAIYVVDSNRRIALANDGAEALLGGPADALLGRPVEDLLGPLGLVDSFDRSSASALAAGKPDVTEEVVTLPDGRVRRYHTIRCPLRRSKGATDVLTISTDVTERARQQQELLEAKEAAEAGARAKSQFLANVSHELRTPMHGILSYARFGLREWGTAERSELRDYFENILDCGTSLLDLLNDLLDLSRLESGRMNFEMDHLELVDVVDLASVEFEPLLQERGLVLDFAVAGDLPLVRADRTRFLQVLRNLLSNATKFTPSGKRIVIEAKRDGEWVRLAVHDEGVGIPEGETEAIFDKFVQSSKHRSTAGGTGLGLAISREIVRAHGGRIWAENRPTGGASLIIELPAAEAARPPEADGAAGPDAAGEGLKAA